MPGSSQLMSGDKLIDRFERGLIAADTFHHADHVRLGFEYLKRYPAPEALRKFSEALLRFAMALGKAERYHETITWAYLFLIRQRMAGVEETQTWEDFAADNADLLIWAKGSFGILERYYYADTLASAAARMKYQLPDRLAGAPHVR
jgi:hypothetical protein